MPLSKPTSTASTSHHPYLSDRSVSSIENWKESSTKAKHSSADKMSDANVKAYLAMKESLYSKRSG